MNKQKVIKKISKLFVQVRKVGSSINRYRKQFRYLARERGSIGKAYQFLRKMNKVEGFKTTKQYLKNYRIPEQMVNQIQNSFISSRRWERNAMISINEQVELKYFNHSFNQESINIHWVIPDFGKGGGGHQTIFRMIKFLEEFGHRQTIWLQNSNTSIKTGVRKKQIQEWYAPIENVVIEYLPDDVQYISGDVVIATDSFSAYPVAAMQFFKERFYFIQDNEAQFYPMGTDYLLASNTYDFGFAALCAGDWLWQMAQQRGMWARSWQLCADHTIYYPNKLKENQDDIIKIAFYARKHTERRAVDLGLAALQELHNRGIEFQVYLFGQEKNVFHNYTFNYEHLGLLSAEELAKLYNKVDIGMVFSATNYSLIPLEMMACGLPVVELDVESTRVVFPDDIVSLAKPNVKDIVNALERLVNDNALRSELSNKSAQFAKLTNWENSARLIEQAIIDRLKEKGFNSYGWSNVLAESNQTDKFKVSIVIPTFNPSKEEITNLLDVLDSQQTPWDFEIVIIDSNSTNDSIRSLDIKKYRNLRIVCIDKQDFQHGKTRKYGAEISFGEIIVYTTQDAIPKNNQWLINLIKPFEENKKIAGVFGRHEAYPHHDEFIKRDIENFFNDHKKAQIRKWDMPNFSSPSSLEGKMFRCFFSDNNSAVRRQVANYIPYPEVDWGEDQVWANEIISSGLEIAYADDAVIVHSHQYDETKTLFTGIQEEKMFSEYFGFYFANSKEQVENDLAHQIRSDEIWAKKYGIDSKMLDIRKLYLRDVAYGRSYRFFK